MKKNMVIYCSGPLFCPEEVAGMTAMARVIEEAGHETFLPHRDGVERLVMGLVNSPLNFDILGSRDRIDRAIFSLDVFQIVKRCDGLVFNMNGRVPDEGGAVEAGIAFAAGKPVVLYKNDDRTVFNGRDNSMLYGLSPIPPVQALRRLPAALGEMFSAAGGSCSRAGPVMPADLEKTVERGERIWRIISSLPRGRSKPGDAELVKMILEQVPAD